MVQELESLLCLFARWMDWTRLWRLSYLIKLRRRGGGHCRWREISKEEFSLFNYCVQSELSVAMLIRVKLKQRLVLYCSFSVSPLFVLFVIAFPLLLHSLYLASHPSPFLLNISTDSYSIHHLHPHHTRSFALVNLGCLQYLTCTLPTLLISNIKRS